MSAPAPWRALIVRVPRDFGEELAAELATFGLGVETRRADEGHDDLVAYLGNHGDREGLMRWTRRRLAGAGLDPDRCAPHVEPVEDGRWVERYQAGLQPFALGTRYTVHPRGRLEAPDDRRPLLLVPGRAFGTGEHATTQLCVERLERRVRPGEHWLDLGCGSGILLLVAADLGAARALGIEIDPDAVDVARTVREENGAPSAVELRCGTLEDAPAGAWDGVVCNISSVFARMHLGALAALPRRGGTLVLSGILEEDVADIAALLDEAGLRERDRAVRPPWALLDAERR